MCNILLYSKHHSSSQFKCIYNTVDHIGGGGARSLLLLLDLSSGPGIYLPPPLKLPDIVPWRKRLRREGEGEGEGEVIIPAPVQYMGSCHLCQWITHFR